MHKDQVKLVTQYAMAIAGWGEDAASQPVSIREEEKLANISNLIKATNPTTITAVYAGQFELVDPAYDRQAAIIADPAYDGFFLHDDNGKPITQNGDMRLWECVSTLSACVCSDPNHFCFVWTRETNEEPLFPVSLGWVLHHCLQFPQYQRH